MKKLIIFTVLLATITTQAQFTRVVNDELAQYKKAKELYTNGEYSLAYPIFKDLQNAIRSTDRANQSVATQDIEYYATVCGLKQNDTNAVFAAQQYIEFEANNPRAQMMNFHLAEYHFANERFTDAIPLYEATTIENLNNKEIAQMKFNLGYSYFTQQQFEKAKPLFNTIRQLEGDSHYLDANYYYGFIAYYDREYNTALQSFKKVENHETYGKVVPFYITEIYYFTGQKDKALQYGENILSKGTAVGYYDLELRQLVGHAYFEKKQFAKALPYLEKYVNESDKVRREDIYELSYCYYEEKRWAKSIEGFKQLSGKDDSLSQNSMYLLGDAYLRVNQKANARNAFAFCAANSSNESQREISKFTYAKLSYELGYTDVALQEMKDFLNEFPNSPLHSEARELLVAVLTQTNNFREAQTQIEALKNPSEPTKKLYPKILYGRAVEYVNDQDFNTAEQLLDKILADKYNAPVLALTNFWKGEISYKKDDLDNAITFLNSYLQTPTVNGEVNPNNAKYILGYTFLRKEIYNRALGYFEGISRNAPSSSNVIEQDAYVRTADCYFMNKEFKKAIAMYDVAIAKNWTMADYATFQKAMATGATNSAEKIALLKTIERRFPTSTSIADANLEIATTYMAEEKFSLAIPFLNTVLITPGDESLKPKALLNLGISYAYMNNDKEALVQYKKLINQYPNSAEAEDALENVEKIYVDNGQAGEYADFMRGAGKPLSVDRVDSLTYVAAEKQYNNNEQAAALNSFNSYLQKFPNGAFSINANHYIAEIYNSKKDYKNALGYYEAVAAKGNSKFAERAVSQAARINYYELKNYVKAEAYFTQLKNIAVSQENKIDALRGLLRSQYYQQKYSEATASATELLASKNANIDDKVLSNLVLARASQNDGNYVDAIAKYKNVVSLNKASFAAEARYEIANCLFLQNKLTEAEKAAFEVVNKSGSYEVWLTKAYILLGDIYFKQKDYFNAKATFQSIIDNTQLLEFKKEAEQKLARVVTEEKANSKIEN
jgi:tetratricopeptide (TPR) repeat protein